MRHTAKYRWSAILGAEATKNRGIRTGAADTVMYLPSRLRSASQHHGLPSITHASKIALA